MFIIIIIGKGIIMTITIIGVSLENRMETALDFQRIITENGCSKEPE